MLTGKTILITGGTGSFGQAFTRYALACGVERIRLLSRDELKQAELSERLTDERIRWLVGDVRDADRIDLAMRGCDLVIHAAAMKRIEKCARDPDEAVDTNILGTRNVVRAAVQHRTRLVFLSTDKACNPITHYGFTKGAAEKIVLHGNQYLGGPPLFSVVRYGNVALSRGSVIGTWRALASQSRPLPVTDVRCTRFWITVDQAVQFVAGVVPLTGGRLHVPDFMPSYKVIDLAMAIQPDTPFVVTGFRGVEKVHEDLVAEHETVMGPKGPYSSDRNTRWLSVEELREAVK